jgi:hypothetical protein
MDATIAAIDCFPVTFDRDRRQAHCPLYQLKLTWGSLARNTTVHLHRPEIFTTLSPDDSGKENMQTKEHSATRNFSRAACVIVWHGDQGNHIPYHSFLFPSTDTEPFALIFLAVRSPVMPACCLCGLLISGMASLAAWQSASVMIATIRV